MLIFNEILECNFFGLSYNIKKNIIKRQKNDYLESNKYMLNKKNNKDLELGINEDTIE